MLNVNQITSQLARMPDQALQDYAKMHKNDPYTVSLALAESNRRKEMRASAQGQQGRAPQPKVVDQNIEEMGYPERQAQAMPEDVGIGALAAPNMQNFAEGGIVAFSKGGQNTDPLEQYIEQIRAEAIRQNVDPDMAVRLFKQESGGKKDAVSSKGAVGLGQLMIPAAKEMGLTPEDRTDPNKNIPASIGYFKKQLNTFNDPQTALAAYNFGPGNVQKHLAQNNGQLNPAGLPKETANYINSILPMGTAYAAPATQGVASIAPANTDDARRAAMLAQIPTGGAPGAGPTPPAAPEQNSFLGRQADRLGIPADVQRNLSNLANASGGAMGAGFIPRYLPKVSSGIATLGERVHELISPSKTMSTAQIEAMQAATAAAKAQEAASFVGPLSQEARLAQTAEATRIAQLPGAAEKLQAAANMRQAQEANRLIGTGKTAQYAGQAAASPAVIGDARNAASAAATGAGANIASDFALNLPEAAGAAMSKEDKAPIIDAAKAEVPKAARKGMTNDDYLTMGFNLLASKSPRFMNALGEAGVATIKSQQERIKDERETENDRIRNLYSMGLTRQADALAKSYESGSRMMPQALAAGNAAYDDWYASLGPLGQKELTPGQAAAKRQEFLQTAMAQFRISGGAGSSPQLSAADQSLIAKYAR
jgi:soluble lytic murein transglycosylase-like protein